ncbi:MAG TPA: hypothetical protein VGJ30_06255 [Candidatus Angelobacter sp.]
MSIARVGILVTLFTCVLALAGYRLRTGHVTASVPAGTHPAVQNREDLRKFMQARIHQEYTFLSFTVWHDRPLDTKDGYHRHVFRPHCGHVQRPHCVRSHL